MHFLLYNNVVAIPVSNLKRIHVTGGDNKVETVQGDEYEVDETADKILRRIHRRMNNGETFTRIWQSDHRPSGE